MIYVAVCIGSTERYRDYALPGIEQLERDGCHLLTSVDNRSIANAYNRFLDEVADDPDVEAIVLIHEDVRILDRNFLARIRRCLRDPSVGVVGVVGSSALTRLGWWSGRHPVGRVFDLSGVGDYGTLRGAVDAIDGFLMVVSAHAARTVRFDEDLCAGFHGYDADYCFSVQAAGMTIVVEPFVVYHHSGGREDDPSFKRADAAFREKWGSELAKPPLAASFPRVRYATRRTVTAMRAFRPGIEAIRGLGADLARTGSSAELLRRHREYEQAEKRLDWLETMMPDGIVVDVECGTGAFVNAATTRGYEAYGVDRDPDRARAARQRGLAVLDGTLEDWGAEFSAFTVDAISMFQPESDRGTLHQIIRKARDLLAPDGLLVIEASREDRASLEELLHAAGFSLATHALSARPYETRAEWFRRRRDDFEHGHRAPEQPLLRIVAARS